MSMIGVSCGGNVNVTMIGGGVAVDGGCHGGGGGDGGGVRCRSSCHVIGGGGRCFLRRQRERDDDRWLRPGERECERVASYHVCRGDRR